jgi:GNAT superfamily N-acetyltransferase
MSTVLATTTSHVHAVHGKEALSGLEVRPIRPDDDLRLRRTSERLSPQTIYRRFFSPLHALPPDLLHRFTNVDHDDREALVALDGDEIIAVVRWDRNADHPDEAEVAMLVEDAWQHRGIGRALTQMLVEEAVRHHICTLIATVLSDNTPVRMLLTSTLGYPAAVQHDGPQTRLTFRIAA